MHLGGLKLKLATLEIDLDLQVVYQILEARKQGRDGYELVQLAEGCLGLYPVHDRAFPVKAYRMYN